MDRERFLKPDLLLSADFSRRNFGKARLLPSRKQQRIASSEWRIVFLESNTHALPKNFGAHNRTPHLAPRTEYHTLHSAPHFGSPLGSPSQNNNSSPNEFGALKFRHQPLAEASGMNG